MKQLELSAEKAVEREEKLKDKILSIQQKFKSAEGRSTFSSDHCQNFAVSSLALHFCMLLSYYFQ